MNLDQALPRLEADIRRLKVEYDVYFAGGSPRPPLPLQNELQVTVKQLTNVSMRTADRFRFNALVGRFNSYLEMWGKQVRAREEGRDVSGAPLPEARTRSQAAAPKSLRLVVADPASEAPALSRLYDRWMDARREAGENPKLSLDSFVRQISKQVSGQQSSRGRK